MPAGLDEGRDDDLIKKAEQKNQYDQYAHTKAETQRAYQALLFGLGFCSLGDMALEFGFKPFSAAPVGGWMGRAMLKGFGIFWFFFRLYRLGLGFFSDKMVVVRSP